MVVAIAWVIYPKDQQPWTGASGQSWNVQVPWSYWIPSMAEGRQGCPGCAWLGQLFQWKHVMIIECTVIHKLQCRKNSSSPDLWEYMCYCRSLPLHGWWRSLFEGYQSPHMWDDQLMVPIIFWFWLPGLFTEVNIEVRNAARYRFLVSTQVEHSTLIVWQR